MNKSKFKMLSFVLMGIFLLQLGGYFISGYFTNKFIDSSESKPNSQEEKEYKQAMTELSGLRARESQELVVNMKDKYSTKVYKRIQQKWESMKQIECDMLYTYNIGYLDNEIIGVGQIWAISRTPMDTQMKSSVMGLEPTWVPVFIYDTGYKHIVVENDLTDLIHSSGAITLLLLVLSFLYRGEDHTFKMARWKLFAIILAVFITVYMPKLIWIFITYGYADMNYPVLSIAVMKGATIAGYLRMMYLLRLLGLMGIGASYYLFSQKFFKKRILVSILIGIIAILLPWLIFISPTVGLLGSFSILVVGSYPIQYNMEYVGILMLVTVAWIVFCCMYKFIAYTSADYEKWDKHFHE